MERVTVVSTDAHISPPYTVYRDYIDPAYRERLDDLETEDKVFRGGGTVTRGSMYRGVVEAVDDRGLLAAAEYRNDSDMQRRLALLDGEGIAGELLLAGTSNHAMPFFYEANNPYPTDVRAAGTRAYHRWLADFVADSQGRMFAHAYSVPSPDIQVMVDEVRYVAERGFVSMEMPGFIPDPSLPPLFSAEYDPFWAACAESGIVVLVHAGWGHRQGMIIELFGQILQAAEARDDASDPLDMQTVLSGDLMREAFLILQDTPARVLFHLMNNGVFDRHPTLKLSFAEIGAAWVPDMLRYLDDRFASAGTKLKLTPQEYFARNCAVTATAIRLCEVAMREDIGIDQLMWGSDFPHPESTFPNTRPWLMNAFRGVGEADTRKILGENAIEFFNLDRGPLDEAAARIGPTLEELSVGADLDEGLLTSFDYRNSYSKPVVPLDWEKIDGYLAVDLAKA